MITPENIVNMALNDLGSDPIQSFDDSTAAGLACALVYQPTIDWLLGFYPWHFNKLTMSLAQQTGSPLNGWKYRYQLPLDRLGAPISILRSPQLRDYPLKEYELQEDAVFCNLSAIWAVLPMRVDPAFWPATFRMAAIACLTARLVMPISGNSGILANKEAMAWGTPQENFRGGFLGAAIRDAARSNPSATLLKSGNPLIDARFS